MLVFVPLFEFAQCMDHREYLVFKLAAFLLLASNRQSSSLKLLDLTILVSKLALKQRLNQEIIFSCDAWHLNLFYGVLAYARWLHDLNLDFCSSFVNVKSKNHDSQAQVSPASLLQTRHPS